LVQVQPEEPAKASLTHCQRGFFIFLITVQLFSSGKDLAYSPCSQLWDSNRLSSTKLGATGLKIAPIPNKNPATLPGVELFSVRQNLDLRLPAIRPQSDRPAPPHSQALWLVSYPAIRHRPLDQKRVRQINLETMEVGDTQFIPP
jgi:hypothetical protein